MMRRAVRPIAVFSIFFGGVLLAFSTLSTLVNAANDASESDRKQAAYVLTIDGAIGPAVADYVHRGLDRAVAENATVVVLKMDTPGGLDKSMRQIVKNIIASPIPVITFVGPSGARAASAGTYILYASHLAVMAPGTNLWAATPVRMGGGGAAPKPPATPRPMADDRPADEAAEPDSDKTAMEKKMVNDAVAYIRSLAQLRNRNIAWAEQAVLEGKSLSAEDALENGVIDVISTDIPTLLRDSDGKTVSVLGQNIRLASQDLRLVPIKPDWRTSVLQVITSPDVAYVLMLIGVYGLFFEFSNPGFVVPGVLGGICLLLALYSLQMLPVSLAGIGLIILGISLLTAEAFIPSFGVLGIGGTLSFVLGSFLLLDAGGGGTAISWPLILGFSLANAIFILYIVTLAVKAYRNPVVSGREELLGAVGTVLGDCDGDGQMRVHGEIWKIRCDRPLKKDETVTIIQVEGLTLTVT